MNMPMMKMPAVTAEHERLWRLVGTWSGPDVQAPMPWSPGGEGTSTLTFTRALDGFGLLLDHVQTRDGKVVFRGHGVYMLEPGTPEVLWYWFDSIGFPPQAPGRGGWEGDVLTIVRKTARGEAHHVWQLDGDRLIHRIDSTLVAPGARATLLSGTYSRVKAG
ncbi:DUF1579 family protein [Pyxidicoccus parkwayensis]|uniref:DUF1579 family protein n=1 Tax=Pyxidicoccus parkwayensis TaxID=2813578 RepID=A0ABX7NXL1_9BACT|nr:DUF1579 family protein [Pyxidicoccus parkwaysis]QSQ23657.1 DUF1579 family protein [Pyxidicoccus parkwaysis]